MAKQAALNKLFRKGRALFLAYDQGLEHGPTDFNDKNYDPEFILDIALEGGFTGVILHDGIAQKYYTSKYRDVPLIIKLNGKTRLPKIEPVSRLLCSVEHAVKLHASAVGYTVYLGSKEEPEIFYEFGKVVEKAHDYGLPVIAWMYPRGKDVKNQNSDKLLAYSARVALELGADIVKLRYNGHPKALEWAVKCAGKTKVVIAGGVKKDHKSLLVQTKQILKAGAIGLAIGRNVWQAKNPMKVAEGLKEIVF